MTIGLLISSLKECDSLNENKTKIIDICRFHSSRENSFINLSDYIDGMIKGQDQIYYLSAETLGKAEVSPHLEGFKSRGIDVLFTYRPNR